MNDTANPVDPSVPAADFFRALERERTQALVAQDMDTAERLHASDYQLITPSGKVFNREDYLAAIAAGPFYAKWDIGTIDVRRSPAIAIVRYQARLEFPSGNAVTCWHTDSYELRGGQWQAVWSQATGHAQLTNTSMPQQIEEQRVLAAEDEYIAAEVARDEPTLRRLVDDQFAFNSSTGATTGKTDFIESVLKLAMVGQSVRERSVLIEGDVALIFGTAELRFADPGKDDAIQNLRYTSTYVKRQGQWCMLALQMQQRAPK